MPKLNTKPLPEAGAPPAPADQLGHIEGPAIQESALQALADAQGGRNVEALFNVRLDVQVILGRSRMPISELLELTKGSVIELDRKVGDPVDITINDRLVARGNLVKINGDLIGVALREIVKDAVPGQ